MRRAWMLALLSTIPVTAVLAHPDSDRGDAGVGHYEFRLDALEVELAGQSGRPPAGFVYFYVQAWVETHDGPRPLKRDVVVGPHALKLARTEGPDFAQRIKAGPLLRGLVVYEHTDCTPPEEFAITVQTVLFKKRSTVPRELRGEGGRTFSPAKRAAIRELLRKGKTLPVARMAPEYEEGSTDVVAADAPGGRWDVHVVGEYSYDDTPEPCVPRTDGTGDPGSAKSVTSDDEGYEHGTPGATPPSAVCETVVVDPAGIHAGTAQLEVKKDGIWTAQGDPVAFTTGDDGRATVKIGIFQYGTYRIVSTVDGVSGTSLEIPVVAGDPQPPLTKRDCWPPS